MATQSPFNLGSCVVNEMCKRNSKEILEASEHLCYEIGMLFHIVQVLGLGTFGGKSPANNAFVEAFAIHVRNIIDFLYEPKTRVKITLQVRMSLW